MFFVRTILILFFFVPILLYAQGQEEAEMVTDRPDQTESALTVPQSRLQIEAGVELGKEDGNRSMSLPTMLVRVGIHPLLELRVGGAYLHNEITADSSVSGLGGVVFGAKGQLFGSREGNPRGALIVEIAPAIGSDGVAAAGLGGALVLCLAHEFGSIALGSNLGVELAEGEVPTGLYSLTYSGGIVGNVGGFLELFGSVSADGAPEHSFNAGTTILLMPNLQLDLANAFPLSDAAPDSFFTAGISWRLPR